MDLTTVDLAEAKATAELNDLIRFVDAVLDATKLKGKSSASELEKQKRRRPGSLFVRAVAKAVAGVQIVEEGKKKPVPMAGWVFSEGLRSKLAALAQEMRDLVVAEFEDCFGTTARENRAKTKTNSQL